MGLSYWYVVTCGKPCISLFEHLIEDSVYSEEKEEVGTMHSTMLSVTSIRPRPNLHGNYNRNNTAFNFFVVNWNWEPRLKRKRNHAFASTRRYTLSWPTTTTEFPITYLIDIARVLNINVVWFLYIYKTWLLYLEVLLLISNNTQ